MGRTTRSITLGCWMLFLCVMGAVSVFGDANECSSQKDCLKCNATREDTGDDGESKVECIKCAHLIVLGSRQCVDQCPSGYKEEWSSLVSYMGRMCRETGFWGIPGRTLAVIVGTCSGAAICMGVLIGGFLYLRHRRNKALKKLQSEDTSHSGLQIPDTPERREFLKHLATLRCEAPLFLAMLNDTRKQVRDLHQLNNSSDSAIQAYRPVLRDLARILTWLNRSEHQIGAPPSDWENLLAWGERVLRRYKRQNPHQVAQAQLVSFLQVPIHTNQTSPALRIDDFDPQTLGGRSNLTTFQPSVPVSSSTSKKSNNSSNTSNQSLQELAISTFNSNYNNAPMASSFNNSNEVVLRRDATLLQPSIIDADFTPTWEFNPASYTILAEWSANLVDDDFLMLGFRPQDEITTEL